MPHFLRALTTTLLSSEIKGKRNHSEHEFFIIFFLILSTDPFLISFLPSTLFPVMFNLSERKGVPAVYYMYGIYSEYCGTVTPFHTCPKT